MDPNVLYWTGALANMAAMFALMLIGVARGRKGRLAEHRRALLAASSLVALFILSYLFKLAFLGREDLSRWSPGAIWSLRFHEFCVLCMVVSGGFALIRGQALARTRSLVEGAPEPLPEQLKSHRRTGRFAVFCAGLALISAAGVLSGMYDRLD